MLNTLLHRFDKKKESGIVPSEKFRKFNNLIILISALLILPGISNAKRTRID